eukprot:gene46821-62646_t
MSVVTVLPLLSLSAIWDSGNGNQSNPVDIPTSESEPAEPLQSIPELAYLGVSSNFDDDYISGHDPLGVVEKLFDFGSDLFPVVPSRDRGIPLNLCLALAVKTGKMSLLLRCAIMLMADGGDNRDVDIGLLTDIVSYVKNTSPGQSNSSRLITAGHDADSHRIDVLRGSITSKYSQCSRVVTF